MARVKFPVLVVLFAALAMAGASQRAGALVRCGPWDQPGPGIQLCEAGIRSTLLDVTASDRQQASEWCWAASISAVFHYYGHPVSQERIVKEAYGKIVNMPGTPQAILGALNRVWIDDNGGRFRASGDTRSASIVTAAQDLANDKPLIIGSRGHAMVLTDLVYTRDHDGRGRPQSATVRDPWPYNPGKRLLTPQEWNGTRFLARIRVANI
jgi:hypothetical protein